MIIISDGKHILQWRFAYDNKRLITISKEPVDILVQEILFEKYWNEISSLEISN